MPGLLDFLSSLVTDPYQQGGGLLAQALNPQSAASSGLNTPTAPAPVSPVAGSPFQFRPGLLGDSPLGRILRGAAAGAADSTGYTGIGALGAGFQGATQAAQRRQLFNMQNLQAGQEYQGGALNLLGSRLGLERTFQQYKYFGMVPPDMTFDQWVATQGQTGQAGGPPAGAPQVGAATEPVGANGQQGPYAAPPAAQGSSIANAPQVGQTPPQGNSMPIDPALANVTDPSDPRVIYALQKLAFTMGQPAADMVQKAMIAGMPYQKALAVVTSQASAGNANVQDRGPGTGVIGLRTDAQGNPLPPQIIARNPVQVPGVDPVTGAPKTNFVFPPIGGLVGASGNTGAPPQTQNGQGTSFTTGLPPGQEDVFKAVAARDTELRDLGAGVNTRINLLQNLGQLASDTKFGTGRETQYTWEKLAQLVPGVTVGQTDAENMDIFKKFVSNLGVQYQQASGGKGTDAQLENALEGLPSVDKLSGAIQKIVPYMIAQESAIKGQLNARSQWKQQNGDSPASLLKFEDTWRNNFDPKVYQFEQMSPQDQAAFKATLAKNPKQLAEFRAHLVALTRLGAVQ